MKTAKRRRLGEVSNNERFTQGNNQAQTFLLIVLVFVIIFFLVSNFNNILTALLGTRETAEEKNQKAIEKAKKLIEEEKKKTENVQTNNTNIIPKEQEPVFPTPTHELQYLLQKAGLYFGIVDGIYGTKTDTALNSWANSTGNSNLTGRTSLNNWISAIRANLRNKGVLGRLQAIAQRATQNKVVRIK